MIDSEKTEGMKFWEDYLNDPKNKVNGGILIDVDQLVKKGKVEGNFFDEVKKSLKIVNDENK